MHALRRGLLLRPSRDSDSQYLINNSEAEISLSEISLKLVFNNDLKSMLEARHFNNVIEDDNPYNASGTLTASPAPFFPFEPLEEDDDEPASEVEQHNGSLH